jgi:dihydrofolate reductase
MRRILVSQMVTADGFFAGPNGEIDWHNVDAEFNDFAIAQLESVDALIFGRVTYELMAEYWPTQGALTDDPIVANHMNRLAKIVVSSSLTTADWNNTTLVKGDVAETFTNLKQQPGKDMAIFGSGTVVSALTKLGLIDEYRIIVNPVVLGRGRTMFAGIQDEVKLRLIDARPFRSGNVLLTYAPMPRA